MTANAKFSVLIIALFHDTLDLCTHKFVIILAIVFQDAFHQFKSLAQSLIFYIELKTFTILFLELSLNFFDIIS